VAAQSLGLGAFDSTNSAQIIEPSLGISAVMCGASVTPAPVLPSGQCAFPPPRSQNPSEIPQKPPNLKNLYNK